jgi:hypothetical protein
MLRADRLRTLWLEWRNLTAGGGHWSYYHEELLSSLPFGIDQSLQ